MLVVRINLGQIRRQGLGRSFEASYNEVAATPFEWKFTRQDLRDLMDRLQAKDLLPAA